MGLLDDMENKIVTGVLGHSSSPLAGALLQMIQNHPGGLAGLVQSFREKGLGDVISSWVSTGQNLPISADQIQQALGSGALQQLAAKAGISPEMISSQLSTLMPTLVDKLTPNGSIPQQSELMEAGMKLMKSMGQGTPAA